MRLMDVAFKELTKGVMLKDEVLTWGKPKKVPWTKSSIYSNLRENLNRH